jgi:hypothetical protein
MCAGLAVASAGKPEPQLSTLLAQMLCLTLRLMMSILRDRGWHGAVLESQDDFGLSPAVAESPVALGLSPVVLRPFHWLSSCHESQQQIDHDVPEQLMSANYLHRHLSVESASR